MTKQIKQGGSWFLEWAKSVKEWLTIIGFFGGIAIYAIVQINDIRKDINTDLAVIHMSAVYMPRDSADHVKIDSVLAINESRWLAQIVFNHTADTALISLRQDLNACMIPLGLR